MEKQCSGLMAISMLFTLIISGCSSVREPTLKTSTLNTPTVYSSTSSMRETYVTTPGQQIYICAQPMPDTAFDFGENGGFSLNLLNFGKGQETTSEGERTQEQELSGRSPAVLQTRELLYRLCEFVRNHNVSSETAIKLYERNLAIIEAIATNESKNTHIAIGDSVNSQAINDSSINEAFTTAYSHNRRDDNDDDDSYDSDGDESDDSDDDSSDDDTDDPDDNDNITDGDNDSTTPANPFSNVKVKTKP